MDLKMGELFALSLTLPNNRRLKVSKTAIIPGQRRDAALPRKKRQTSQCLNCSSSVEPLKADVEDFPPVIVISTSSK